MSSQIKNTLLKNLPMIALAAALVGAGLFAVLRPSASAESTSATEETPADPSGLPPGHPSVDTPENTANGAQPAMPTTSNDSDAPAITWTPPLTWKSLPSTSTMRLATSRIPRATGDTEDTDLSVVRAGGSTDANVQRWIGQFENGGKDTRTVKLIHGIKTTIVEVHGTFSGGGMSMDNAPVSHPNWTLLAAIVEAPGTPYFFKMTGPTKSVAAARPAFDALLASITPTATP
jgi:hypothetical protein